MSHSLSSLSPLPPAEDPSPTCVSTLSASSSPPSSAPHCPPSLPIKAPRCPSLSLLSASLVSSPSLSSSLSSLSLSAPSCHSPPTVTDRAPRRAVIHLATHLSLSTFLTFSPPGATLSLSPSLSLVALSPCVPLAAVVVAGHPHRAVRRSPCRPPPQLPLVPSWSPLSLSPAVSLLAAGQASPSVVTVARRRRQVSPRPK